MLIEDTSGTVRGNVQPGDIILAIVSRGQTTEAKNAEQVNGMLSKMEKGASVTFRLRRGEQEFFSTLRSTASEARRASVSEPGPKGASPSDRGRPTAGAPTRAAEAAVRLTLLLRAYCHLCDEMLAAREPLAAARARPSPWSMSTPIRRSSASTAIGCRCCSRASPRAGDELCHFRLDPRQVEAALGPPAAPRAEVAPEAKIR